MCAIGARIGREVAQEVQRNSTCRVVVRRGIMAIQWAAVAGSSHLVYHAFIFALVE